MTEPTTFGDLKKLLAKSKRGDYPSRVNGGMTHSQALDILEAATKAHADDQSLDTPMGDLIRRNVVRECVGRLGD